MDRPPQTNNALQPLVNTFWNHGGDKLFEQRPKTDIAPDRWLKAQLMAMIDDAKITFDEDIQ